MLTIAVITTGLTLAIIRGQSIKPMKKKPLDGFPPELKKFLRELNWYI